MKFVHPNVLYFLFLLIIPIIIHLFNFRRYKKLYFSSLFFIKKVEKETSSTRNLKHYLILASRLLALAALILAFAQPYFPEQGDLQSRKQVAVIYLDNSFSMSAKGSNGSLLNQGKEIVQELVNEFPREQEYILVTNEMDGSEHRVISRSEVSDKLETLDLSPISRSIATPLKSIQEYIETSNLVENANYYVISDFQKRFLQEKTSLDSSSHYSFLKLNPQIDRNIYIDSVWFEQPFHRININNELKIRIHNTSKDKLTNVEVNLHVGNTKRQALVDLEADNHTVISLNYTDKTTGFKEGTVEITDESLYFDNRFHFSYEIKEHINVLIVNDRASTNFPRLVYQTDDYYQVEETAIGQLKTEELTRANLIVLNEIQEISSGILSQLRQLAENGTSILIIPSSKLDKASYNQLLLSFQLPMIGDALTQDIRIGKVMSEMDFFTGMFEDKIDQIRMPPLKRYFSSNTYTNANYNPLILYENGMPLLVQQAKINIIFAFYSSISEEFNNFGKSALFAASLLRISEMSQGKVPLWLTIGSSEEYTFKTAATTDGSITLSQESFEFIPEMSNQAGHTSISVRHAIDNQAIKDGIYSIKKQDNEDSKLALNYNREESDMIYAKENEVLDYFKTLGVNNITIDELSTHSDTHLLGIKKPNEFWRILLFLALLFFLIEMAIITFWKT